jgi:hypothetical protein
MSAISRVRYYSWQEFKRDLLEEFYEDSIFRSGTYLFRGLANADWELSSAFDRRFQHLQSRARLNLWSRLVESFRGACEDAGISSEILQDERKLLAFGQHYGLPTRLLDWTLSPYVGAFFSFRHTLVSPGNPSGGVALWILNTTSSVWSLETGVEIVSAPALANVRLRNQGGRFTLARTPFGNLERYVESLEGEEVALTQVILPTGEAVRALPDLDAMGINSRQLFPDMTGLTEQVMMRLAYSEL